MRITPAKAISQMIKGFALIASFAFAGAAIATETGIFTSPDLIEEIEYGLVCDIRVVGSTDAPNTDLGEINLIEREPVFASHSTVIPSILGVSFGVKSSAAGDATLEDVVIRVKHPPLKQSGTTEQSWTGHITAGVFSMQFYTFDFPTELVTGIWTMSAHKDGQLLYRVRFNVVHPDNAPLYLTQLCKGRALSS